MGISNGLLTKTGETLDVEQALVILDGEVSMIEAAMVSGMVPVSAWNTLVTVAFTGSYNDLINTPVIPAAQVNADWNASTGVATILNKPSLFSGAYVDLTGKPTLFSGAYADLTGKPTIPSAQIQSDWSQGNTGALDYIKNKPTIPAAQTVPTYIQGTTARVGTRRVCKTANLTTAGTLVVYLTDDGLVTGNALFSTVFLESLNITVNDSSAPYQFSWVLSNANKTLTITVNRAVSTLASLLGINILAAPTAAPIGTTVNISVDGI